MDKFKVAQPGDPVIGSAPEEQIAIYEIIVAALIRRYGGKVVIEPHELFHKKARAIKWASHRDPDKQFAPGIPQVTLTVEVVEEAPTRQEDEQPLPPPSGNAGGTIN
jgi:hypothetical protein